MRLFWLFVTFAKVGIFSFGGGYAMIPLIQREIVDIHGWLSTQQFVDVVAIAEMTPGPIAVNSATFTGFKVAGVCGAAVSTLGVTLPSYGIILIAARFFFRFQTHSAVESTLYGVRPVVMGLIAAAAFFVGKVAFTDLKSVIIALFALFGLVLFKIHPIVVIMMAAALGMLLYTM
ncbi:MAG: chromate transporter [bacterium]